MALLEVFMTIYELRNLLVALITNKINTVYFDDAPKDVVDFLKDKSPIALWSASFFIDLTSRLKSIPAF